MKIYVASSWRNDRQPFIVDALREAGYEVYDFRNPEKGNIGFHWSEIDLNWRNWSMNEFRQGLKHPVAANGFQKDWNAMCWADACVMVMPCGRSAHLEAGFFVGANKPLIILLSNGEPELMYKMATGICVDFEEMLQLLEKRKSKWIQEKVSLRVLKERIN